MPTLINYNQSTFKNQPKPNKRRLQELQHSAARAHAARVAYWRKKGVPLAKPKSPERSQSQDDGNSNASTESAIHVKQEPGGVGEPLSNRSSCASDEIKPVTEAPSTKDVSHGRLYTTRSVSGSTLTTSYSASTPNTYKWQQNSETGSSEEGQALETWGKSAASPRLTRLPISNLFDPFNTTPIAQDAEVVAAMDHCINTPTRP
jgi:hypothetical protein